MQQRINMQRPTWAWLLETHIPHNKKNNKILLLRAKAYYNKTMLHSSDVIHLLDGNKDVQVIIDTCTSLLPSSKWITSLECTSSCCNGLSSLQRPSINSSSCCVICVSSSHAQVGLCMLILCCIDWLTVQVLHLHTLI